MEWKTFFSFLFFLTFIGFLYYVRKSNIVEKKIHYKIDNQLFFDPNDFKLFDELKNNWKIIQQEAKHILENSPRLEITRTYDEWKDSHDYMNIIMNKFLF